MEKDCQCMFLIGLMTTKFSQVINSLEHPLKIDGVFSFVFLFSRIKVGKRLGILVIVLISSY